MNSTFDLTREQMVLTEGHGVFFKTKGLEPCLLWEDRVVGTGGRSYRKREDKKLISVTGTGEKVRRYHKEKYHEEG